MTTKAGYVQQVEYDLTDTATMKTNISLSSEVGSQKMRDLLTSIGHMSAQLSDVQGKLQQQRTVLEKLTLASLLASNRDVGHKRAAHNISDKKVVSSSGQSKCDSPFELSVKLNSLDLGHKLRYSVIMKIKNVSPVCLTGSESLVVTICGSNSDNGDESFVKQPWQIIRCNPLILLDKDGFQVVCVDLPDEAVRNLPLTVKPVVVLSLGHVSEEDYLNNMNSSCDKTTSRTTSVPIPLPVTVIDILHALRPTQTTMSGQQAGNNTSSLADNILELAKRRPTYKDKDVADKVTSAGHYTTSIHLQAESVKYIIRTKSGNLFKHQIRRIATIMITTLYNAKRMRAHFQKY